jgi:hypothetical protein
MVKVRMSFVRSIGKGLLAGAAGTAAMTAYQLAVAKAQGKPLTKPVPHRWADAPAPAQVAKRLAGAIGEGQRFTREDVPKLTNAMHWLYGTGWGAAYALLGRPNGALFGTGVWVAAYAELVPMGIYAPPWKYPAKDLAVDFSYHLVYGAAVQGAYAALSRAA